MIDRYINSTRDLIVDPVEGSAVDYYTDLFNKFKNPTGLHLKIIKSRNRDCEVVNINNKKYIVYDQYMGQSLFELNKIFICGENPHNGFIYSCKILSEYLYRRRQYIPSLLLANHYDDIKPSYTFDSKCLLTTTIQDYTLIQESFILAHEFAHEILSNQPEGRLKAISELKAHLDSTKSGRFLSADLKDYIKRKHIENFYLAHGLEVDPNRNDDPKLPYSKYFDIRDKLYKDDDFLEEALCDEIAMDLVLRHSHLSKQETIIAAITGLLHIRYIAIANRYSFGFEEFDQSLDFFFESVFRVGILQDSFKHEVAQENGKNDGLNFTRRVHESTEKHFQCLTNVLLHRVWTIIKKTYTFDPDVFQKVYSPEDERDFRLNLPKFF